MTPNAGPDPVNKWATEHYGFEDDAPDPGDSAVAPTSPQVAGTAQQHDKAPRPRRRTVLIAAGALSLALLAGIGGAAVAAESGPDGPGGGTGVNFGQGGDL